jgi:CRP/FNR family transcriptional regulator
VFTSVYAVRAGCLKTYRVTEEGEEQIMGFHLPGEVFGFGGIGSGAYRNSAVALDSSAVCEIPYDRLEDLGHQLPALQRHFVTLMSREITEDQDLLVLLSKKTAEQRLASFLLALSSRLRRRGLSGTEFRLPMSRSEIGNYLGLVIETVSRVLGRFQRDGILQVDGRDVVILEPSALSARASP